MASDSTVSEDGLTYTFPLREGVLFHNGEEVTTDDVIYSFETCAETTVDTAPGRGAFCCRKCNCRRQYHHRHPV